MVVAALVALFVARMPPASADPSSPAYQARDVVVQSFDGAGILVHFFPAEGLQPGQRAPTVLSGHGWGGTGDPDPDSDTSGIPGRIGNGALRRAGYNVLTWDARGFGLSDGVVQVNAPEAEALDTQALIDFVATQPEALLDCVGDPRVGMVGYSYGGAIQLTSSGVGEDRLDALIPDIAWSSLRSSLYPDETPLSGWISILLAIGVPAAEAHGEGLDPHIHAAEEEIGTTGVLSHENTSWFESRGPGVLVEEIRVPTFFTQGTVDTLFRLDEAVANFSALRANGVPVKMMWYCGGHGACTTRGGTGTDPDHMQDAALAWLARHLGRDASVDTGPRFEWLADDGVWRGARDYPLAEDAPLVGTGTGALTLRVTSTDGAGIMAMPAAEAVNIPIAAPDAPAQVVGSPRFSLTYSGLATARETRVFAQVVDRNNNVVLGNQATPIPVILDGQVRTITRSLEAVATSLTSESRLELQIVNASDLFVRQRAAGALNVLAARVELPVGNAGRTPDRVIVRADLTITRSAPDGAIESAGVVVRTSGPITRVRVRLHDAVGGAVATAPQTPRIASEAAVRLRMWTLLAPGRYQVTVSHAEGEMSRWVEILPPP
jgi:ABC-2 type transport system ATP-binding protein